MISWWTLGWLNGAIRLVCQVIGGITPATVGIVVVQPAGHRSPKWRQADLSGRFRSFGKKLACHGLLGKTEEQVVGRPLRSEVGLWAVI